ncbi:MAG: type II toxin-antitoxin system prevent-host-death family antitoxin [Propionibacteriaceae bacterium]|jgi:prevent-host-death family protein|nr:type II toxin-antitoxin system prevent-host-death family antitoxin [Propionibacteriaceae bacterium]
MLTVPVRQLNQHTAQVLDLVTTSGQPVAVTKNGRVAWHITPATVPASPLDALIGAGLATRPSFDLPLPAGPRPVPSGRPVADLLAELDGDH